MTDLDLMIRAQRLVSTSGEVSRIIGVKDGLLVQVPDRLLVLLLSLGVIACLEKVVSEGLQILCNHNQILVLLGSLVILYYP